MENQSVPNPVTQEQITPESPIQFTSPLPPISQNKTKKIIVLITGLVLLLILAGSLYLYAQKEKSSVLAFDDSDLKISYTEIISPSENSASVFNAIPESERSITSEDRSTLDQYISDITPTNLPPISQANEIISKYSSLLKIFDENAHKPYQCNFGKGDDCSLTVLRNTSYLAGMKALVLFQQGEIEDVQKIASDIVSFGKNVTKYADAEITISVGWTIQKDGYSILHLLNSENSTFLYSETEKENLIAQLRSEHKRMLQYGYTRMSEGIDYLTSADNKPVSHIVSAEDEEYIEKDRKAVAENPQAWNPNETKKYYYDSFQIMISNIDLPCGSTYPESKIEIDFDSSDETGENYIGRTFYTEAYSDVDSLNIRRCAIEDIIRDL